MMGYPVMQDVGNVVLEQVRDRLNRFDLNTLAIANQDELSGNIVKESLIPKIEEDQVRQPQGIRSQDGFIVRIPVVPNQVLPLLATRPIGTSTWDFSMNPDRLEVEPNGGWLIYPASESAPEIKRAIGAVKTHIQRLNTDIDQTNRTITVGVPELVTRAISLAQAELAKRKQLRGDTGIEIIDQ
jgi:hypothetical protein